MSVAKKCLWILPVFSAGFAAGLYLRPKLMDLWNNPAPQDVAFENLLAVPDVRQSANYSCGASALQAVLAYWGVEAREDTLIKSLKTDEKNGTRPEEIIRVAREYGLRAAMREGIDIADLRQAWQNGIPVIVAIQAWTEDPRVWSGWENDWEDGHYAIAIGIDSQNIYFEDPSLLGSRGVIRQAEFLKRWHDYAGDPPFDARDRAYIHLGLFIEGSRKTNTARFTQVQ